MIDLGAGEKCMTVDCNGNCDIAFNLNECADNRQFYKRGIEKRLRSENLIGYLGNKQEFLYECWRLLEPGGRIRLENMAWGCPNGMHPIIVEVMLWDAGFKDVRMLTPQHLIWPWGNFIMEAMK